MQTVVIDEIGISQLGDLTNKVYTVTRRTGAIKIKTIGLEDIDTTSKLYTVTRRTDVIEERTVGFYKTIERALEDTIDYLLPKSDMFYVTVGSLKYVGRIRISVLSDDDGDEYVIEEHHLAG